MFIDNNFIITKKEKNTQIFAFSFIDKKGKSKTWELRFETMADFNQWTQQICISKRPIWDPLNSDKCVECSRTFNFFRRQHHCRNCGRVVCGDHSESRFILDDLNYLEPVRVCDTCNKKLS